MIEALIFDVKNNAGVNILAVLCQENEWQGLDFLQQKPTIKKKVVTGLSFKKLDKPFPSLD